MISITEGGTSTPGSIATFDYDDLGRRTLLTRGNGTSTSYAYDPVSRLQSLVHSFPAAPANDLTLGFSYNPASQIVENTRSNDLYSWTGHGSGSLSSPANGLNQMTSLGGAAITHDAKGNLTSEGGRSFSYSSENLLTGFTGPTHTHVFYYDPLMRLRQMETPGILRRHHIRDGDDLVREYNDNTFIGRHVHGPGADEPLYTYRASNGQRWWYHADERGSIVAASLPNGTVLARAQYDEYGRMTGGVSSFEFTGKQSPSGVAGILYSNARMYDPKLSRFLQPDPIGYDDGPNMYAYVGADPVNMVDPTGLTGEEDEGESIEVNGKRLHYDAPEPSGAAALLGGSSGANGDSVLDCSMLGCIVTPDIHVTVKPKKRRGGLRTLGRAVAATGRLLDRIAERHLKPPEGRRPRETATRCIARVSGDAADLAAAGSVGIAFGGPFVSYPRATAGGGGTSIISSLSRSIFGPNLRMGTTKIFGTNSVGGALGRGISKASVIGGAAAAGLAGGKVLGAVQICQRQ
jgi:RHS repeat-associated protein